MCVDFWGTCFHVLSSLPGLSENFLAVGRDIKESVGVAGTDEKTTSHVVKKTLALKYSEIYKEEGTTGRCYGAKEIN